MNWFQLANLTAAVAVSAGLNSLWLGLLLAALAAGMIRLLPHSNATTRYAIWFTALLLAVAAPIILLIPGLRLPPSHQLPRPHRCLFQ